MITSYPALAEAFSRTDHKFDLMYSKRALRHRYVGAERDLPLPEWVEQLLRS